MLVLKFNHYLIGANVLVRMDHQTLKWLLNWDSLKTSKYCIWKAELEIFEMIVEFREGKKHNNADPLSRLPPSRLSLTKNDPKKKRNVRVYKDEDRIIYETSSYFQKVITHVNENDTWQQTNDSYLKTVLGCLSRE